MARESGRAEGIDGGDIRGDVERVSSGGDVSVCCDIVEEGSYVSDPPGMGSVCMGEPSSRSDSESLREAPLSS
jgi:hypothetical protein